MPRRRPARLRVILTPPPPGTPRGKTPNKSGTGVGGASPQHKRGKVKRKRFRTK